ncbi:MAG TPA: glycoside hydrolase family 3 N-terminal domain-containing protein [Gemmatimonadaceae bacterium]|nr:glycoside hydrolase family 3 N-terminal domain-containing protein [Gemmatimonadaceae bacterium]
MRLRTLLPLLAALLAARHPAAAQARDTLPYRDPARPVAERVRDLLGRMTLEEKFWQLYMSPGSLDDATHDYAHGAFGLQISALPAGDTAAARTMSRAELARAHATRVNAIQRWFVERTRLGIPIIPFDEALHGLMRDGATVFPQAIALAASWDTALVARVSAAAARETRSRGVRQALSPVVNVATDVRWGRVEETYGEDPYLASAMARAFVGAFERAGVVATPKHLVANVGEGGRDSYPIDASRRALEERHFPPFRAALAAGARSVMTAYNSVDGVPATQNRWLLTTTLKHDWGFGGFVISDAAATGGATVLHHTEPSTPEAARHAWEAGLDVVFQSTWEQHRPYLAALRRGLVPAPVIDSAVARVLRAKFELGLFERPYVDPDSAAAQAGSAAHRALARAAAAAGMVLLRNERGTLPLPTAPASIAVIGADATEARLGGYTASGARGVSILDGLREAVGARTTVRHAPGVPRLSPEHVVVPADWLAHEEDGGRGRGLRGEYFTNITLTGQPAVVRADERVDFGWTFNAPARGLSPEWYAVRWTGTLTVPAAGVRRLGVDGDDGWRLWLDDSLLVDRWREVSYGAHLADVALAPGSTHHLRLEFHESTGPAHVKLVWDAGVPDDRRAAIDSAVAAARASDVAVVVAGIEEGEFRDRAFLSLPGHQEELIQRVAATGTPTVVVLVGGSAITMSRWLGGVDAVLLAWYPGEEGGRAAADVLLGRADPGGRLPITFPIAEGQLPLRYDHKPTGRGDDYLDLTGKPLFPFGFGLSYATFAYSDLRITPDTVAPDGRVTVRATVRNTGAVAGDEVVQLYLRDVLATVARPVLALKGFAKVHLAPGESREVTFTLGADQLRLLDRDLRWVVEPGRVRVLVGRSSADIRLRGELVVR